MTEETTPRRDATAFHAHAHGESIAFTGERVIPDEPGWEWCYQAHRFGYDDLVSRIPGGSRVLEIGCGEGYGTSMLSAVSSLVVACDYAEETVTHARSKYGHARIAWVVCDAQRLPFRDDAFDVVASLQVIEHFTDTDAHLSGVAKTLRADGFHYCATPNIALASPDEADNEFHLRDFDAQQLETSMASHFSDVELFGQFYNESSPRVAAMRAAEGSAERTAPKVARAESFLGRLPGRLRVRARGLVRRAFGAPTLDADAARNAILAQDFEARGPAAGSFCLFAISRRPKHPH